MIVFGITLLTPAVAARVEMVGLGLTTKLAREVRAMSQELYPGAKIKLKYSSKELQAGKLSSSGQQSPAEPK